MCQQLLPDYEEKIANFREFTQRKIAEYSIEPDEIINMNEVPLTFDLPLTRTVNKKGESSITLRKTGHERMNFTCLLGCKTSRLKLPPMVIFHRVVMPKEKMSSGISVKVNKKGCGLLRDKEERRSPSEDGDEEEVFGFESENEGETGRVTDEAIVRLFISDTEEEEFGGFRTHGEVEDEDE